MPAGRPRKPIEVQVKQARGDGYRPGNRKPDLPNGAAGQALMPAGPRYAPVMPMGLGDRGEVEWHKIWDAGPWLRPDQDYPWVEMAARAYDLLEEFRAIIARDGLTIDGALGELKAHPLLKEIRDAERTIMKCLSTIGFSPTDRARLGHAEVKRQKGLAELQAATKANRGKK